MTSLLHLVMQFKPIKSTPMQFHLLFSPPSNAFLHLPCSSACPAPPQAGHPNTQHFYGGFFVQLSLPWHQQEHMLWARPLCILESSQICPSSLHTTCSHVQPLPIPPRAHAGGVAAQVLLGQSFLQVPGTITATATCCSRAHPGSHMQLLLGHLNTHLLP